MYMYIYMYMYMYMYTYTYICICICICVCIFICICICICIYISVCWNMRARQTSPVTDKKWMDWKTDDGRQIRGLGNTCGENKWKRQAGNTWSETSKGNGKQIKEDCDRAGYHHRSWLRCDERETNEKRLLENRAPPSTQGLAHPKRIEGPNSTLLGNERAWRQTMVNKWSKKSWWQTPAPNLGCPRPSRTGSWMVQ